MTLYQLQIRGQRNRYLTLDTDEILDIRFICVYICTILTAHSIHTTHDSRNEQQLQEEFHCLLKIHCKPSTQSFRK